MNPEPRSAPSLFSVFGQRKMAALLFLGFSSGLPLFLTSSTLQAWMTVEKVDLATVGLVSLLSVPYSFKFLIAPLMDRYIPPFLGRRRGWLVVTQVALLLCIAAMSLHDPRRGLQLLAINALLIAFFSAAQDVVVDAYSIDVLEEREMGAGASLKVMGYRLALIVTGGVALMLADRMSWPTVYLLMAALMLVGVAASVLGAGAGAARGAAGHAGQRGRGAVHGLFAPRGAGHGAGAAALRGAVQPVGPHGAEHDRAVSPGAGLHAVGHRRDPRRDRPGGHHRGRAGRRRARGQAGHQPLAVGAGRRPDGEQPGVLLAGGVVAQPRRAHHRHRHRELLRAGW